MALHPCLEGPPAVAVSVHIAYDRGFGQRAMAVDVNTVVTVACRSLIKRIEPVLFARARSRAIGPVAKAVLLNGLDAHLDA